MNERCNISSDIEVDQAIHGERQGQGARAAQTICLSVNASLIACPSGSLLK